MPTYEYECTACGHHYEKLQSMNDERDTTCPECGGEVRRLIGTGAGIIFKGGGFYQTDYRSKEYKEQARSEKKTESGDSPSAERKTDSAAPDKTPSPASPEAKGSKPAAESKPPPPSSPTKTSDSK